MIVTTLFGEGDFAFLKSKAQIGIIEAIAIKKVRIIINEKTFGQPDILYVDTLNTLYMESELVNWADAYALAYAYLNS